MKNITRRCFRIQRGKIKRMEEVKSHAADWRREQPCHTAKTHHDVCVAARGNLPAPKIKNTLHGKASLMIYLMPIA